MPDSKLWWLWQLEVALECFAKCQWWKKDTIESPTFQAVCGLTLVVAAVAGAAVLGTWSVSSGCQRRPLSLRAQIEGNVFILGLGA